MLVEDLVARGRYPHQRLFHQWSSEDARAVAEASEWARLVDLMGRTLETLSGGQRQRVWLAIALAQRTSVLLLVGPTAHLDIRHQVDLLDLCAEMQRGARTVVAVLHDLNLACRINPGPETGTPMVVPARPTSWA